MLPWVAGIATVGPEPPEARRWHTVAMASPTTSAPRVSRVLQHPLWLGRAAWVALLLVYGPGVASVVAEASTEAATAIETSAWLLWFAGLVAWLVPAPASLTVIRMIAPLLVVGAAWAVVVQGPSPSVLAALLGAIVVNAVMFSPTIGDPMIDASSYGPERRMALRPTAGALVAAPVLWAVAAVGVICGPTLIVGEQRVAGGIALVVGWAVAGWIGKGLHRLARRWLVFVPAGVVVHDAEALAEPVLVPRAQVARFVPATESANADRLDLTGNARGLGLALSLAEPLRFGLREGSQTREVTSADVVVTPSLPGQTLHQATIRGFKT